MLGPDPDSGHSLLFKRGKSFSTDGEAMPGESHIYKMSAVSRKKSFLLDLFLEDDEVFHEAVKNGSETPSGGERS